jgi:hypothetical protein
MLKRCVREPQPIVLPEVKRKQSDVLLPTVFVVPVRRVYFRCEVCGTLPDSRDCYCGYCGTRLERR